MDWVNQLMKINNKFKFQLFGKVIDNLQQCYDNIAKYDIDNTTTMIPYTFNLFLNSFGIFLTTQQLRTIQQIFSINGQIKYIDFIENVRHDISQKRIATIDHIFNQLSQNNIIKISDLLIKFDSQKHPHNRCLMKKPQQIYIDFEKAIKNRSNNGILNQHSFKEYFLDVNACIPKQRQEYFVDILIHGFKLMDGRVTIDRLRQMQVTIFEKVRQRTQMKSDEGQRSQYDFRYFDMQDKGVVDYGRFIQTMQKLGCLFTHKEMQALYVKHAGLDMILTYEEMCGLLFQMGSGVKQVENPVFTIAKNNYGITITSGMTKSVEKLYTK